MSAWPGTLPDKPVAMGFTLSVLNSLARSSLDPGYPAYRMRSFLAAATLDCRYFLTNAQRDILEAFYLTVGGSDTFTWVHPSTGNTMTARFASELAFSPRPAVCWMVNFQLLVM